MPTLSIDTTRLYCEDAGSGPALVFVHGFGTSARVWNAQLAELVADHRVVAYDWRGCGRSGRPADGNTIARNARDLLELIDALGLARPVLVGSSIGATFATAAALRAPDAIGGLVVIDGPAHFSAEALRDRIPEIRRALVADRAATLAGWVANWFGDAVGSEMRDWTTRQILDSGPYIDALLDDHLAFDPRPRLAQLEELPTAFVHGRHDAQVPLSVPQECAGLSGGELHVIEDAGHMPHMEQPAAVNAVLRAVAARVAQVEEARHAVR